MMLLRRRCVCDTGCKSRASDTWEWTAWSGVRSLLWSEDREQRHWRHDTHAAACCWWHLHDSTVDSCTVGLLTRHRRPGGTMNTEWCSDDDAAEEKLRTDTNERCMTWMHDVEYLPWTVLCCWGSCDIIHHQLSVTVVHVWVDLFFYSLRWTCWFSRKLHSMVMRSWYCLVRCIMSESSQWHVLGLLRGAFDDTFYVAEKLT